METEKPIKTSVQITIRYIFSVLFVAFLLFLPAGTISFWNAWLFLAALFVPMLFVLFYLIMRDPELLKKRIKTRETEKTQKFYLVSSIFVILVTFIIPGLDFRYNWSHIPVWLEIISTVVMMTGYYLFFLVMKQNSYASRVIEIQQGQKVIDTGLYSIVRHPMYFAATLMFLAIPFVLDSLYALIPDLFIPFLLIIRILNEEKVLRQNLPGYTEYTNRVRYRLIPWIW